MVFWIGRAKRRDCKKRQQQQQQRGGASSNADETLSSSESSSPLDKQSKKSLKRQTSNKKELNDLVALAAVRVMSRVRQDAANPSIEAFCPNQGRSRWASPAVPQLPPNDGTTHQRSPPLTFDQARSLNTVSSGVTWDSLYSFETASLYSYYFLQRDKEDKIVRKHTYDDSFDEGFASDDSDDAILPGCHALWCS